MFSFITLAGLADSSFKAQWCEYAGQASSLETEFAHDSFYVSTNNLVFIPTEGQMILYIS